MKNNILHLAIPAILLLAVMAACTHTEGAVPRISFSQQIMPIIRQSCSINSSCHIGATNDNGHIDLSDSVAYNTIISKGLVNTASPTSSLMYSEIQTGFMPPGMHLPANEAKEILDWIKQGALNN